MFKIFKKDPEIGVKCVMGDDSAKISFFLKSDQSQIGLPLDRASRKLISQRAPKRAMSFFMVESFLSNLVADFEPNLELGREVGFTEKEMRVSPIAIENGALIISYPFIYLVNFGESDSTFGLSPTHLKELGVPKYDILRIELFQKSIPKLSDFAINWSLRNERRDQIEINKIVGSVLKDGTGHEYFLLPSQAALLRIMNTHRLSRTSENYKNNMSVRLKELAGIKECALKAKASIHKAILDQNIIILQDLSYEIGRGVDDEVVIRPVMPEEYAALDGQFQSGVNALGDDLENKQLSLRGENQARIQIILEPLAKERLRKINMLRAGSQEDLERVIQDPTEHIGIGPRLMMEGLFSDRVCQLLFGAGKASSNSQAGKTSWAQGFEGNSVFWSDSSGLTYRERTAPVPEVYEKMKRALINEEKRCEDLGLEADFDKTLLVVEGVASAVSARTVKEICTRVESMNRPILNTDEEIGKAKVLVTKARNEGLLLVDWSVNGELKRIPVSAIEKSIPQIKSKNRTSPEGVVLGAAAQGPEVIQPDSSTESWSWGRPKLDPLVSEPTFFLPHIVLQDHQKVGASWLKYLSSFGPSYGDGRRGGLIADDMGVGKTIQVLSYLGSIINDIKQNGESVLIVAPVNLINSSWVKDGFLKFFRDRILSINGIGDGPQVVRFDACPFKVDKRKLNLEARRWQDQMEAQGTGLSQCDISRELKEPIERIQDWVRGKIVLCSYEALRINSLILGTIDFRAIILDEAQKIKNENALQANAAKSLKSRMNIAMSGTPIENSIMDLWNLVDFVVPGKLGDRQEFREKYLNGLKGCAPGSVERASLRKQLETELDPIWLRRTKRDLYSKTKGLPEIIHYDSLKSDANLPMNAHLVEMSESQFAYYDDAVSYLKQVKGGDRLAAIQRMLQLCLAPWLSAGIEPLWARKEDLFSLCPKLKKLFEILDKIRANSEADGQKCLLFVNLLDVQFSLASLIRDWHLATAGTQIDVLIFNGEVKPDERDQRIQRFKDNKGFQVLIISPRSGGVGLNLQDANHVIHYTREWNPAVERQATDRAFRIGQTRPVHVYYPITTLRHKNLVCAEEHLAEILRKKREVMDDFTLSNEELLISTNDFANAGSDFKNKDFEIRFEDISSMDPIHFEILIAVLMEKQGYRSEWVGQARDRGADVLAFGPHENFLIQVKHTGVRRHIPESAVGDPRRAKSTYENQKSVKFNLALVTNFQFTESCATYAQDGELVVLWDGGWLSEAMRKWPVRMSEINAKKDTTRSQIAS